jgi:hypothetical protein
VPGSEYAYDRNHHWRNSMGDALGWNLEDHYRYFVLNDSTRWPDPGHWDRAMKEALRDYHVTVEEALEQLSEQEHEDVWNKLYTRLDQLKGEEVSIDDDTIELGIATNPGQGDVGGLQLLRLRT